ncbi:MAG: GAF domain-containing protein [Chloroflexi bacterium]|nr:GAF domain-containing protein [Chloroflexota bacterium]
MSRGIRVVPHWWLLMDTVDSLKRQRSWVFVVAGVGIAAVMGASLVFTSGEPAPIGLYVIYWTLAMLAGGGIVRLGYAQAIRSATRLKYLADISDLSDSRPDAIALINRLSEILKDLYKLNMVAYQLYDEAQNPAALQLAPGVELTEEYQGGIEELMKGAADEALGSQAPVLRRMDELNQTQQATLASLQSRSFLLLPLVWRSEPVGMLCSTSGSSHGLGEDDSQFLALLGQQVARSLHTDALLNSYEELRQEATAYQEAGHQTDLNSVLLSVIRWAGSRLQTDGAGVTLLDPETRAVSATAGEGRLESWGHEDASNNMEIMIANRNAIERGEVVRINDIQAAPASAPVDKKMAKRLSVNSIVAVPLRSQERVLGSIVAVRSSSEKAFTDEDERRLTAVARRASIGIENALVYAKERDRIARLEQTASFTSSLVYNISHELRTSLAALKAATELLIGEEGIEPGSEFFERLMQSIARNVVRLEALVSNIVDMASLDNQGITLNLERLDVGDFVAETTSIVAPLISKRGQTLSLSILSNTTHIVADKQRLSQILVNLLSNANKYAPEGSEISLSARNQDDNLICSVRDSGHGIPDDDKERVFEAFYRVQGGSDVGVPGSGLGLAIVKSLVELHKGAIWVEDNPAGGATFVVSLPIEGVNESPAN